MDTSHGWRDLKLFEPMSVEISATEVVAKQESTLVKWVFKLSKSKVVGDNTGIKR